MFPKADKEQNNSLNTEMQKNKLKNFEFIPTIYL